MKTMENGNLKKQIYHHILDGIIRKTYATDYILKEKELAEEFGVSKAPVREALIELSNEDIVKSIPRAGYRIVQFTEKDIYEATEIRICLEVPVMDTIIPLKSRLSLQGIYQIVEEDNYARTHSMVPLDVWWNGNIRFHLALNALSGNSLLTATLERIIRRQWRGIAQLYWTGKPGTYLNYKTDTHSALLRAIEEGNKKKAKKILTDDVLSIREQFTYV
jgi:DNA-binding GntR family transcriptional regulator